MTPNSPFRGSLLCRSLLACGAAAAGLALVGCPTSGGSDPTVAVTADVPIAYSKRANTVVMNPLNGAPTAPGGDLIIRPQSSASAPEINVTAPYTQGFGDVVDPEVSYDGKKIVFAMRCPTSNTSTINNAPACTGRFNIWEYDTTNGLATGSFRRITSSTSADDVHPAYLPAGQGFVFTSNRQTESSVNQALGQSYFALDEYERERVFNLHTMDANGNSITQISFNQSHDRNPVVRPNGDIMYSRWDHVGGRNRFTLFTAKQDGTGLFVLYGAHNAGNSFLHPRDMDPNGTYKGIVTSDLMPLDRTDEGGALMLVDAANFSEESTPANNTVTSILGPQGQQQATTQALNFGSGVSQYGRISAPYPLWDGTNRVLVAYAPCEVSNQGVVVSCSTLSATELATLSNTDRLTTDIDADPIKANVPPTYAIYMFDPAQQTFLIVAAPPSGFIYDSPVALQARTEPVASPPTSVDPTLAAQGLATLDVRSVYDTDGLGRMGTPVLAAVDLPTGCTTSIAETTPSDPTDTRAQVADLVSIKDPAKAAYVCAPARFVRAVRAVAPPSNTIGLRTAIGNTDFEQQQILGYAPIEPDGSFKLNVPADTPIGLSVVDIEGRSFQVHTNWIQVRPGERRTCDGCHSPRRGAAINSGAIADSVPAAWLPAMQSAHLSGETMADTRTRLDPTALLLATDMTYTDIWADTSKAGVSARPSLLIKYTGNTLASDDLQTPVPTNGIVNYPDHIQPMWSLSRGTAGANTCTNCHTAADANLNLLGTIAGTGRMASYESLTLGPPLLNASGQPVTEIDDGVAVIERGPSLANVSASEGDAVGMARKSRLMEIMSGETLMADAASVAAYPNPPASAPDHSTMLNKAEKRLLAEWMDLGGKYYNNPFSSGSTVQTVTTLNQATFTAQILPIEQKTCAAGCHQGIGSNTIAAGTSFVGDKLVLTGDPTGDFNATMSMISNTCSPASNYLLSYPSTVPHPVGAVGQSTAVLPVGSADYNTIAAWIATGCPTP